MAFIGKSSWPLMCGAALLLMAAGCQTTSEAPPPTMIDTLLPASPPPDAAALRPGLAVYYANIIANSIADVEIAGRGRPGKPLPHLNWQASDTPVMTSALATQVSAQIAGYIRFPEPGTYVNPLLIISSVSRDVLASLGDCRSVDRARRMCQRRAGRRAGGGSRSGTL